MGGRYVIDVAVDVDVMIDVNGGGQRHILPDPDISALELDAKIELKPELDSTGIVVIDTVKGGVGVGVV